MAKSGRPRKQQPWRPGAPAPIQAAGCGPERRVAVHQPIRPVGGTLRLTPTGYAQDLLGTWRTRKQKRTHRKPGATIINDRQYEAGRAVEAWIEAMAGKGVLRAFDLTVPVVDQSFRHRQGGDPKFRDAYRAIMELRDHLGKRDLEFVMTVLGGMGIHGAMLREAGLPWRQGDEGAAAQAILEICSGGGPLTRPGAYRINPNFAKPAQEKSGSFEVEDRQSLTPLGRTGPIDRKHLLPNENGFVVDEVTENTKTATSSARRAVSDNKAAIELDARRDELENLKGLKDPKSKARREALESKDDLVEIIEVATRALHSKRHPDEDVDRDTEAMREMHRINPPPDRAGHGAAADMNSIGSVVSFEDLLYADRSTRQRAIDEFGITACELASSRFRALLSKVADFLEADERRYDTTAVISEQAEITQGNDIPFDVGIFEDAMFTELETVTIHH
jgi:hypothetical protein